MSGIEVSLDAEAVQRELVQAIIQSTLGEKLAKSIDEALKPSGYGRGSVIDQAIAAEVNEQVRLRCRELIREEGPIREMIEAELRAALDEQALKRIVSEFVTGLGLSRTEDFSL